MNSSKSVQVIKLQNFNDERGSLTVLEEVVIPFEIKRVYSVKGREGATRGEHSHKRCSQFMFCVSGKVEVLCDDGKLKQHITLEPNGDGLFIPPCIWSEQTYLSDHTIINVACDRSYEKDDYISEYDIFLSSIDN